MTVPIQVTISISDHDVAGLLCCAFEGGSNYWYDELTPQIFGEGLTMDDFGEGGRGQILTGYWHWSEIMPLTPGCVISLRAFETGRRYTLDREKLETGMRVFQRLYPKHFGNLLSDSTDATDGDVFLQCCIFGEAVYG